MKFHVINADTHVVENTILADDFASAVALNPFKTIVDADMYPAHIGDIYNPVDNTFTRPAPVPFIPETVTRSQALKAMFLAGITESQITDQINLIPDATLKAFAMIDFQNSSEWHRQNPTVLLLGEQMSLDLDALFAQAYLL